MSSGGNKLMQERTLTPEKCKRALAPQQVKRADEFQLEFVIAGEELAAWGVL